MFGNDCSGRSGCSQCVATSNSRQHHSVGTGHALRDCCRDHHQLSQLMNCRIGKLMPNHPLAGQKEPCLPYQSTELLPAAVFWKEWPSHAPSADH